jgi:hypothetical protein
LLSIETKSVYFHEEVTRLDNVPVDSQLSRFQSDQEIGYDGSVRNDDGSSLEDRIFLQLELMGGCWNGELQGSVFDVEIPHDDICIGPFEPEVPLEYPKNHRHTANDSDHDTCATRWTAMSSEFSLRDDEMSLSDYDSTEEDCPASVCRSDKTNLNELIFDEDEYRDSGVISNAQGSNELFNSRRLISSDFK